jgi:hypothetical protein
MLKFKNKNKVCNTLYHLKRMSETSNDLPLSSPDKPLSSELSPQTVLYSGFLKKRGVNKVFYYSLLTLSYGKRDGLCYGHQD